MTKKYGEAVVIFDGYGESSTKDMVHQLCCNLFKVDH